MKKILMATLIGIYFNCKAQTSKIKDLSNNSEMNYILSRIYPKSVINKELNNGTCFVTVFEILDSKITPEDFSEEHEFLSSLIVSIIPDGDYYS